MVIVTNCIHIHSFLMKRTYSEHIADAPEEEDKILAQNTNKWKEKMYMEDDCVSSARKCITKGKRN